MPKQIRSMNDLLSDIRNKFNSGDTSVLNSLKSKNGKPFKVISEEILLSEAKRLRECIQKHIDEYYKSYSPGYHKRTRGLQNALVAGTKVHNGGKNTYVGLFFDNNLMESRSAVTREVGNNKLNINDGWEVGQDVSFHDRYRFGYFEGYPFIELGIADFLRDNPYKLKVIRLDNPKSEYYGLFLD